MVLSSSQTFMHNDVNSETQITNKVLSTYIMFLLKDLICAHIVKVRSGANKNEPWVEKAAMLCRKM